MTSQIKLQVSQLDGYAGSVTAVYACKKLILPFLS
jgi:hypothetical protein